MSDVVVPSLALHRCHAPFGPIPSSRGKPSHDLFERIYCPSRWKRAFVSTSITSGQWTIAPRRDDSSERPRPPSSPALLTSTWLKIQLTSSREVMAPPRAQQMTTSSRHRSVLCPFQQRLTIGSPTTRSINSQRLANQGIGTNRIYGFLPQLPILRSGHLTSRQPDSGNMRELDFQGCSTAP